MARTPQNYSHNNQLSSSAESLIAAVSANTTEIVRTLKFRNTGSSVRTVTVYIVESGGSADTGTELIAKAISAGKTWNVIDVQGESFTEGMSLQAKQDAGTDVNANCSGTQVT